MACPTYSRNRELATKRGSADFALSEYAEQDDGILDQVAASQRADLEQEIETLNAEAERRAKEVEELTGEVPF